MSRPAADWVVVLMSRRIDQDPVLVQEQGDFLIGEVAGWTCTAKLVTETLDGRAFDTFTVAVTEGDVEVRTGAKYAEGDPPVEGVPLQISVGTEKTPVITLMIGTRARRS